MGRRVGFSPPNPPIHPLLPFPPHQGFWRTGGIRQFRFSAGNGGFGGSGGFGGNGGFGGIGGLKPTLRPTEISSFPRRRESRLVGTETYRIKRFLEILRPRFPLSWE